MSTKQSNLKVVIDPAAAVDGANKIKDAISGMSKTGTRGISRMYNVLGAGTKIIKKVYEAFSGFYKLLLQVDIIRRFIKEMVDLNNVYTGFISTMKVVDGTVQKAAKSWVYLMSVANKLGVQMVGLAEPFARLSASLKGVNNAGSLTKRIFESISMASVVLHKNAFDTNLMFKAIEQAASKGRIQLEEFQKQLAQQLPGAMRLAAVGWVKVVDKIKSTEGATVNTGQALARFYTAISDGSARVADVISGLSNQINEEFAGAIKTASQQYLANLARLRNIKLDFFITVGQSGAMDGIISVLDQLSKKLIDSKVIAKRLGELMNYYFQKAATAISRIDVESLNIAFNTLRAVIIGFTDPIFKLVGPIKTLLGDTSNVTNKFSAIGKIIATIPTALFKAAVLMNIIYESMKGIVLEAKALQPNVTRLPDTLSIIAKKGLAAGLANYFGPAIVSQAKVEASSKRLSTLFDLLNTDSTGLADTWAAIDNKLARSAASAGILGEKESAAAKAAREAAAARQALAPLSVALDLKSTKKLAHEAKILATALSSANIKLKDLSNGMDNSSTFTSKLLAQIKALRTPVDGLSVDAVNMNHALANNLENLLGLANNADKATTALKALKHQVQQMASLKRLRASVPVYGADASPKFNLVNKTKADLGLHPQNDTASSARLKLAQSIENDQRRNSFGKAFSQGADVVARIKDRTAAMGGSIEAHNKLIAVQRINNALEQASAGATPDVVQAMQDEAGVIRSQLIAAYDELIAKKQKAKDLVVSKRFIKSSADAQSSAQMGDMNSQVALGNMSQADASRQTENLSFDKAKRAEDAKFNALTDGQKAREDVTNQHNATLEAMGQAHKDRMAVINKEETSQRMQAFSSMFGNLATLMNSHSRKAFEIGKAAATAQAVIDTISSAQKAFTSMAGIPYVGPILGGIAAAAALAAGYMRVQKIQSTQFGAKSVPGGAAGGGGAPSSISIGSNKPATLGSSLGNAPTKGQANTAQNVTNHIVVNATNATPGVVNMINQGVQSAVAQAHQAVLQDVQSNGPIRQTLAA